MPGYFRTHLSQFPRRDLIAILSALTGIVALVWWYLYTFNDDMAIDMTMMMTSPEWDFNYSAAMFLMWAIMMVGMMLPSVAPTVLIYAMVARKAEKDGKPVAATSTFVVGYLIVWIGFSLLATLGQYFLDQASLLSAMMVANNRLFAGILLLIAGIWQFTPLKEQCLEHCRSPVEFIFQHWQNGNLGAIKLGLRHGLFCLGCCWAVMILLFVVGVMNLIWIALISLFVLLEKVLPRGKVISMVSGSLLITTSLFFFT